jgi:hypothetical protein
MKCGTYLVLVGALAGLITLAVSTAKADDGITRGLSNATVGPTLDVSKVREGLALNPSIQGSRSLFPDLPVLTTRYGSGSHTFLPFLGVGFGHGETADVTRQIFNGSTVQGAPSVQRLLGNNLMPNEFQVGIHIPF